MREMRARFSPHKGFLDQIKEGVQYVLDTVQDAGGKAEQKAKVASISASSASSAAAAAATRHTEL